MKEFILAPTTGVGGSTGGVMFSPDKAQRLLYISDLTNNHIWFLNREDGKVVNYEFATTRPRPGKSKKPKDKAKPKPKQEITVLVSPSGDSVEIEGEDD